MAIHGNKSQAARTKALADFKAGELQVLVATDIAARGIDIDQLPHVVNFELPNVPEDYVHRIGRTGRAGASGEAISLACVDEEVFLRDIERLIKRSIPREVVPGFEPPARRTRRTHRAGPHDDRRRRHAAQGRWRRWLRRRRWRRRARPRGRRGVAAVAAPPARRPVDQGAPRAGASTGRSGGGGYGGARPAASRGGPPKR